MRAVDLLYNRKSELTSVRRQIILFEGWCEIFLTKISFCSLGEEKVRRLYPNFF